LLCKAEAVITNMAFALPQFPSELPELENKGTEVSKYYFSKAVTKEISSKGLFRDHN
jgi:hypothetical protein